MNGLSRINKIGLMWEDDAEMVHVKFLRVDQQSGTVELWIGLNKHTGRGAPDSIDELVVYLTPQEAMAFGKAFSRCAIAAFREGS